MSPSNCTSTDVKAKSKLLLGGVSLNGKNPWAFEISLLPVGTHVFIFIGYESFSVNWSRSAIFRLMAYKANSRRFEVPSLLNMRKR